MRLFRQDPHLNLREALFYGTAFEILHSFTHSACNSPLLFYMRMEALTKDVTKIQDFDFRGFYLSIDSMDQYEYEYNMNGYMELILVNCHSVMLNQRYNLL